MSRCVALVPGWDCECRDSNTVRRISAGTNGRGTPALVSQMSDEGEVSWGMVANCRVDDSEAWSERSSGSSACAFTIASKSTAWGQATCSVFTAARESASATGLSPPLTCRMPAVN